MSLVLARLTGVKTVVDSLLNDLGVAASIVIVASGIFGVYQAAVRIYSRTVGSRRDLARRLNELAAGVTLRYVEERFGTPAFSRTIALPRQPSAGAVRPQKRTLREVALVIAGAGATAASTQTTGQAHAHDGAPCDGQSFRELVFREKHAWVQVLADDNDAVARFSVTVTDPRFGFSVRDLSWGHLTVRLGHSRFSDVREGPARSRSPSHRPIGIKATMPTSTSCPRCMISRASSAPSAHHADPDVDRPPGSACGCAQITRSGTAPGDRHTDLAADH